MLKGIITISGQPGLFKVLSDNKNNVIVESLETGKKLPSFSNSKMSALEDISVYTMEKEVSLTSVFDKIYKKEDGGNSAVNHKSSVNELKSYFVEVLPDYDRDQVYVSDIKKILRWYNILLAKGLIKASEEKDKTGEEQNGADES